MGRSTGGARSFAPRVGLVFAAAAALVAAACSQRDGGPLVLSVGGAPRELAVWDELVRDFEEQSGIEVEILRQPSDSAQQRQNLVIALDSGQRDPDVLLVDVAWIGLFAAADWLEPLEGIDRSPFFRGIVESVDVHEDRLVALPVYVDAGVLYYRTDLVEDGPPATWEELRQSAARVQERQRHRDPRFYGFVWQGAQYEGLVCTFLEFAGSEGGFARPEGRLLVDLPANRRALELMRDLVREDGVSPPSTYTEMREEEVRQWFQSGHALYERNWPYAWAAHQSEGSPVRGRVAVAPLPAPPDGEAVSTLGGWHIAVSRGSDRKPDAQRLVAFVTSREAQKEIVRRLGWNPGRSDLYEDPEVLDDNPHFRSLREAFGRARARPALPWYPQVSRVLQRALSAVLAGRSSPEAALGDAQSEIDALARRYRATGGGP